MYKKIVIILSFLIVLIVIYAFANPSTDLEQAKSNIISLIQQANYAEAQVQTQQLLTDFAGDEKIAETIWQIAAKYKQMQEYEKACELNQYNVDNYPDDIYALWSQTEIIEHYIRNKGDLAVESEFNNLITIFAAQPTLPKEIWRVASMYDGIKEYDKALEINKYNIEHFPNDIHAMWSQVGTIYYYLRNKDDDGFDREFKKLYTTFAEQEILSREIWNVAGKCDELEEYDKALEVNRYNIEHFPDRIEAMWSQVGTIYYYLRNQDDDGFDREFEKLYTIFAEQETLPKEIWFIACRCDEVEEYDKALEVNRYNIEHFPNDIHALRSQVGTIYYYLRNQDNEGFDREYENLYTIFAEQPTLAEEIFNVAKTCDEMQEYDKAFGVNKYNIEHFPGRIEAMWSQVGIIYYHLRNGDYDNADSAADNLLTVFSGQPTLPKEIYLIADRFSLAGNHERAVELYQSVIDRGSVTSDIDSQVYAVMSYFALDDDETAQEQLDKLIADFNDYPDLPKVLSEQIALGIYGKAMRLKAKYGLDANSINEFHKAISIWSKIASDLPISQYTLQSYYCRAVILSQELSQYADGIELFEYLVSNWPDYEFSYNAQYQIGKYYDIMLRDPNTPVEQIGQLEEKREQGYISVIEKYPNCDLVKRSAYNLGGLHYKKKDWELAAAYYDIALRKSYETNEYSAIGKITYRLGQSYKKLGQSDDAKQVYQQYLDIAEPNDPTADKIKIELQNMQEEL